MSDESREELEADLAGFRELGLKLNLLFNGNCYGAAAVSKSLGSDVTAVLDHLSDTVGGVEVVTTTSPFVAHVAKTHSPSLDVRASVNMRIGTVEGLSYMKERFDSFYVQREFNRDLRRLDELSSWAKERGKKLHILANSGCLNHCSNQTFHDNLVAHEDELCRCDSVSDFNPVMCWEYLANPENRLSILRDSNWVRPEDLHHYEDLFASAKLATRLHSHPARVIRAYATSSFAGNLLDLLEPGFASLLEPDAVDNSLFPKNWFAEITRRRSLADRDQFCAALLRRLLISPGALDRS